MGKTSFKRKNYHSEEVLELVHTDFCGPIGIVSCSGEIFFIPFVDDYSRMMTVIYLKEKYEAFQNFKVVFGKSRKINWKEDEIFKIRQRW